MERVKAATGTVIFLAPAPGTVAGLFPWWITGWQPAPAPGWWLVPRLLGGAMVGLGAVALLTEFARFALQGVGTPAPVAPTRHLVVGGLYRHARNPMYVAVIAVLLGQTVVLASPALLAYSLAATTAMVTFARWYEEPALLARHGDTYQIYRDAVPGWLPQLRNR